MWRVKNGPATCYLLGTIHFGSEAMFYPLPAVMERSFESSQKLIGEIDESKQNREHAQLLVMSKGLYQKPDKLENHVSEKTQTALSTYLQHTGKNASAFSLMRPWLASMAVVQTDLKKHGFESEKGIDRHFMDEASTEGKPIGELESADSQIDLLSSLSDDLQDKLLLWVLSDSEYFDRDFHQILKAWRQGNADEMIAVFTRAERQYPELKPLMEKILYQRNIEMAKKIEQYLEEPKTYFIVVGAAHLAGERGLVSLLRNKHYTVEQLRQD